MVYCDLCPSMESQCLPVSQLNSRQFCISDQVWLASSSLRLSVTSFVATPRSRVFSRYFRSLELSPGTILRCPRFELFEYQQLPRHAFKSLLVLFCRRRHCHMFCTRELQPDRTITTWRRTSGDHISVRCAFWDFCMSYRPSHRLLGTQTLHTRLSTGLERLRSRLVCRGHLCWTQISCSEGTHEASMESPWRPHLLQSLKSL